MDHQDALSRLCRVCGGTTNKHRVSYSCMDHQESLRMAFSIEVQDDSDEIHPARFCMRCSSVMKRKLKALEEGNPYLQSMEIFEWAKHDSNCNACTHFCAIQKGGRPKNSRKNRGRPSENGYHDLIKHAQQISPISFYSDTMNYTSLQVHVPAFLNIDSQDLECFICLGVLNGPIRLSCGSFVCSTCLIKCIERAQTVSCPVCFHHPLVKSDIQPLEPVHLRLLEGISLKCNNCSQYVLLRNMNEHIQNGCCSQDVTVTHTQVQNESMTSPPNVRLAADIIKKKVHNGRLTVATRGQVSPYPTI